MSRSIQIEKIHAWHAGWPSGWERPRWAEQFIAEQGWLAGAERRLALAEHYASPKILAPNGPHGLNTTCLRAIVTHTAFVLKLSEKDRWPHNDESNGACNAEFLEHLGIAYKAGYAPAVKHAYRFCKQMNIGMPVWVREWHDKVMEEQARTTPREKRKAGRHKGPASEKWMNDLETFVLVNLWRNQPYIVHRDGTPRWISFERALELVRVMRFRKNFETDDHTHLATLRKAYNNTVKRFKTILHRSPL